MNEDCLSGSQPTIEAQSSVAHGKCGAEARRFRETPCRGDLPERGRRGWNGDILGVRAEGVSKDGIAWLEGAIFGAGDDDA